VPHTKGTGFPNVGIDSNDGQAARPHRGVIPDRL
jgi:hypothetical protein